MKNYCLSGYKFYIVLDRDSPFNLTTYEGSFRTWVDQKGLNIIRQTDEIDPKTENYKNYQLGMHAAIYDGCDHIVLSDSDMLANNNWLKFGLTMLNQIKDCSLFCTANFYRLPFIGKMKQKYGYEYGEKEKLGGADVFLTGSMAMKIMTEMPYDGFRGWDSMFSEIAKRYGKIYCSSISFADHFGVDSLLGHSFHSCLNFVPAGEIEFKPNPELEKGEDIYLNNGGLNGM